MVKSDIWRKTRRSSKSSSSGTTAVAKQASSRGEYIHVHFCFTMNHPMAVVSCSCVLLFLSCHTNRYADTSTTTSAIVTKQPSEWTLRLRTQMSMGSKCDYSYGTLQVKNDSVEAHLGWVNERTKTPLTRTMSEASFCVCRLLVIGLL